MEGMKFDSGKTEWSLLPWKQVEKIVKVLEFGAKKYDKNNWQKVGNSDNRYSNATMRHLLAHMNGEKKDPESGLSHLAHAACNILFMMWFEDK